MEIIEDEQTENLDELVIRARKDKMVKDIVEGRLPKAPELFGEIHGCLYIARKGQLLKYFDELTTMQEFETPEIKSLAQWRGSLYAAFGGKLHEVFKSPDIVKDDIVDIGCENVELVYASITNLYVAGNFDGKYGLQEFDIKDVLSHELVETYFYEFDSKMVTVAFGYKKDEPWLLCSFENGELRELNRNKLITRTLTPVSAINFNHTIGTGLPLFYYAVDNRIYDCYHDLVAERIVPVNSITYYIGQVLDGGLYGVFETAASKQLMTQKVDTMIIRGF
jgi:hypothetical protein